MNYILSKDELKLNETAYRFQGEDYGDLPFSFFWVFTVPGSGPGLHVHPYEEVFVLQKGQATFTVGEAQLEIQVGQIVIAPPNTPHKFINSGTEPLQLLSIHASKRVIQTFLEP
ncbi:cupin domain-containing protein [Tengunoibacter tsumagoiensis]|uniref:Cupin n=1 Tax=Tengunoibacter tsumagoiensis TaxID=2014871 RepID=A0A401ZTX5_9CHLR|nr:cupin domain-containing protein [Tengunoibacter tsumagoiensis]GCE10321.1 cupin [Tengunoibacter tsumagoiensis]